MMNYRVGWIFLFVVGLVIVGIIALIIYALVRVINSAGKSGASALNETPYDNTGRALAVLAERYAKGEISDEEYRHKKAEITKP